MQKDEVLDLLKSDQPIYVELGGHKAQVIEFNALNSKFQLLHVGDSSIRALWYREAREFKPWVDRERELDHSDLERLLRGESFGVVVKGHKTPLKATGIRTEIGVNETTVSLRKLVQVDEGGHSFVWIPVSELRIPIPTPKFKVGDRAKVRDSHWGFVPFYGVSDICYIASVGSDRKSSTRYSCEFTYLEGDKKYVGLMPEEWLEEVEQ